MARRKHCPVPLFDRYVYIILLFIGLVVPLVIIGTRFSQERNNYAIPMVYHPGNVNPIAFPKTGADYPPILAYTIFGSKGDSARMLRILKSIYHPRNQYLLYLDSQSPNSEREKLRSSVESYEEFQAFGNVHTVVDRNAGRWIGASSLAAVLHASALLLKTNADWDWFTVLSSSDYPLIPQDDILYFLSSLPRHLNFIKYNCTTVSDENEVKYDIHDIVVDPNIYLDMKQNTPVIHTQPSRKDPDAFKIYRGSPWMILSRNFIEHCVIGYDNFPRKLMMYLTNVALPLEYYFHTALCHAPEFHNTIVNTDLRYSLQEMRNSEGGILKNGRTHDDIVIETPAAFARPYEEDDPLLEEIDTKILHRFLDGIAPGSWCIEPHMDKTGDYEDYKSRAEHVYYRSSWGSIDSVKPGHYGKLLKEKFASDAGISLLVTDQCQGFIA